MHVTHPAPSSNIAPLEHTHITTTHIHKNKRKNDPTDTIINIYRRPRKKAHLRKEFYDCLQDTIDGIFTKYPSTELTIQGDLNLDLLNIPTPLYDLMIHNALHTTITTPTRYNHIHKTSTLLDVTLTTNTTTQITAGTISPPITDHLPPTLSSTKPQHEQHRTPTKH